VDDRRSPSPFGPHKRAARFDDGRRVADSELGSSRNVAIAWRSGQPLQMFAGALMRRGRCCPWRLVVAKDSVTETAGVGPQDRAACPHDLVLLDLCLPDRDGEEVQGTVARYVK
jgi:hypothetical protein